MFDDLSFRRAAIEPSVGMGYGADQHVPKLKKGYMMGMNSFNTENAAMVKIKVSVAEHRMQLPQFGRAVGVFDIDKYAESVLIIDQASQELPPHLVVEVIVTLLESLVVKGVFVGYDDRPESQARFVEKQIDEIEVEAHLRGGDLGPFDFPLCRNSMCLF